jgi:integrase
MPKQNKYGPGITKQKLGFYVTRHVPPHLQDLLGAKRLVRTLQTDSVSEARRRAPLVLAKLDAMLNTNKDPLDIDWWRTMLSNGSEEELEIFHDAVDAEVGLEDTQERNLIKERVLSPLTETHVDAFIESLEQRELRGATVSRQRVHLSDLSDRFPYLHQLTKKAVAGYVEELLSDKSAQTVRGYKSAWAQYYEYLSRHDVVDSDNPFRVIVRDNRKRTRVARTHFTSEQIRRLLKESEDDQLLHDLILIGAYTGCRIGELGNLRIDDIEGDIIVIRDAKTKTGHRRVPIHTNAMPTLQRLMGNRSEGFVFEFTTVAKGRSTYLAGKFSPFKSRLGYGPELVFHSLRKTVATLLQNAGVTETTAAAILGHDIKTMSYGLYSGGVSDDLKRDAIASIDFRY